MLPPREKNLSRMAIALWALIVIFVAAAFVALKGRK